MNEFFHAATNLDGRIMNRNIALLPLLLVLGVASGHYAAEPPKAGKDKTEQLMRQKLDYAKRILSGISTEDFAAIRQNAEAMQALTRLKEFDRAKPQEYRAQLLIFDFANTELIRFGKEKNLDGAALAYTQLTLSCVNCHKVLRAP